MLTILFALACLDLPAQYAGEPPLLTRAPVQSATFGATALGVQEVAQLNLMPLRDAGGNILANQSYLTATVRNATPTFYQLWSGTYVPGRAPREIVANNDVAPLNNPTVDMFACNVSGDLLVCVFDSGATSAPVVATRATPIGPFGNPRAIAAPVPVGYRDSQLFDRVGPSRYEYGYAVGRQLFKVVIDVTTGATVGSPTILVDANLVTPAAGVHSHWAMRQWTGQPASRGTCRALLFSKNDNSADCYFRSSLGDNLVHPMPLFRVYSDANWKANPASIGGSTYWAYAPTAYGDPLRVDMVTGCSASVPASGGALDFVVWTPPGAAAICFVVLGLPLAAGLPIPGVLGNLSVDPTSMVVLPPAASDPQFGEAAFSLAVPALPRFCYRGQVGCLEIPPGTVRIGATIEVKSL